MCDEAVDTSPAALKFIPDWFATSKMSKKLYMALYADDGLPLLDEDSSGVTFCRNQLGNLNVNLNNINLDNNFDEDDPDTIILIRFWLGIVNLKNVKHLKKHKVKN